MDNILLDTDVLLDFFFDRKPHSDNSSKLLSLCDKKEINGFVTPVIVVNMYYILRKTANHSYVVDKLKSLLTIIDVLKMDKDVVLSALNSKFKDFEDAMQNYTAINSETIGIIVTRNIKDFKKSSLAVLSPETYLSGRETI